MYCLIFLVVIISGCVSQDAIYRNICSSLIETFDCSQGFPSKKLCGSDGSIYETECDFAIAHCRDIKLQVLHSSASCDGSSVVSGSVGSRAPTTKSQATTTAGVTMGQGHTGQATGGMTTDTTNTPTTITTTTPIPTTLSALCQVLVSATCPDTKAEVCGSDKEDYDNTCKFEIAKCHNPTLTMDHQGVCKLTAVDVICKAVKDKTCPSDTEIVCGSDGKTYSNLCEFDKGKCVTPGLKLAGIGKC